MSNMPSWQEEGMFFTLQQHWQVLTNIRTGLFQVHLLYPLLPIACLAHTQQAKRLWPPHVGDEPLWSPLADVSWCHFITILTKRKSCGSLGNDMLLYWQLATRPPQVNTWVHCWLMAPPRLHFPPCLWNQGQHSRINLYRMQKKGQTNPLRLH